LRAQYDPTNPAPPVSPKPPEQPTDEPNPLDPRAIDEKIDAFLLESGALVRVTDAARGHGQIRVFANSTFNTTKAVPGIVIRNEDYGRISRLMADGIEIEMEVEISNTIHSEDQTSANVCCGDPRLRPEGSDRHDGAHIDSWHAGTGATDNAAGVAVMMEAARVCRSWESNPGGRYEWLCGEEKNWGCWDPILR